MSDAGTSDHQMALYHTRRYFYSKARWLLMARGKETFGVVKSLLPHCRRLQEAGMRTEMVGSPGSAGGVYLSG